MNNDIQIQAYEFPSEELIMELARANEGPTDKVFAGVKNCAVVNKMYSDYFAIFARDELGKIVGFAHFIQNENEKSLWFYPDIWVAKPNRRQKIATRLINKGLKKLADKGAKYLYCTVSPKNKASLALQKSLGFQQRHIEKFDYLGLDGLTMFRRPVSGNYRVVPLIPGSMHVVAVRNMLADNETAEALHFQKTDAENRRALFNEINSLFMEAEKAGEFNFIIEKGVVPAAWLKLNGFGNGQAWISILIVAKDFRRCGIGEFAVRFAEEFIKSKEAGTVKLYTTEDNTAAQSLYEKCGYILSGGKKDFADDLTEQTYLLYEKNI
ncbi:MAG: GNAT family N-acetyltransferase [Clostridia bacterium]